MIRVLVAVGAVAGVAVVVAVGVVYWQLVCADDTAGWITDMVAAVANPDG